METTINISSLVKLKWEHFEVFLLSMQASRNDVSISYSFVPTNYIKENKNCAICHKNKKAKSIGGYLVDRMADTSFYVCKTCLARIKKCDCCGSYVQDSRLINTHESRHPNYDAQNLSNYLSEISVSLGNCVLLCRSCLNSSGIEYCERCESWHVPRVGCRINPSTGIGTYDYKPEYIFHTMPGEHKSKSDFMGIEIESSFNSEDVGNRSAFVQNIRKDFGDYFITKNDGSIRGIGGVELVTQPSTLKYYQHRMIALGIGNIAKKSGYRGYSDTSCGIHIHYSKAGITPLVLRKIWETMYSHQELLYRIAQRSDGQYCEITKFKALLSALKDGQESRKYSAIHILKDTIEFRIFRSNFRPLSVMKNIEFIHALVDYAKQKKSTDRCDLLELTQSIGKNKNYWHAALWFNEQGLIVLPKEKESDLQDKYRKECLEYGSVVEFENAYKPRKKKLKLKKDDSIVIQHIEAEKARKLYQGTGLKITFDELADYLTSEGIL